MAAAPHRGKALRQRGRRPSSQHAAGRAPKQTVHSRRCIALRGILHGMIRRLHVKDADSLMPQHNIGACTPGKPVKRGQGLLSLQVCTGRRAGTAQHTRACTAGAACTAGRHTHQGDGSKGGGHHTLGSQAQHNPDAPHRRHQRANIDSCSAAGRGGSQQQARWAECCLQGLLPVAEAAEIECCDALRCGAVPCAVLRCVPPTVGVERGGNCCRQDQRTEHAAERAQQEHEPIVIRVPAARIGEARRGEECKTGHSSAF